MNFEDFPFGQPPSEENKPSKDCGYRCMYYVLGYLNGWNNTLTEQAHGCVPYSMWLDQFRFFQPVRSGITFSDICAVLDFYKTNFRFTQLSEEGLYIIYSGVWLHSEGKKHGHYFIYHDGIILCSTHSGPYKMPLKEVEKRLEAKSLDHAFRCLKILGTSV